MESQYRSTEINNIASAMAKAQGAYKPLRPNQIHKGEKYANLEAILAAVREPLSNNALAFFQHDELLDEGSGAAILKTTLMHESGQWISSWARIVSGKTDKETASIYEFRARLHAVRLLGIAPSAHDPLLYDDNGEMQAESVLIEDLSKPKEIRVREKGYREEVITNQQYNQLMITLKNHKRLLKNILEKHDIESLDELPASSFLNTLSEIHRIKQIEEEGRNNAR